MSRVSAGLDSVRYHQRLLGITEQLGSGLLEGGVLTINADPTLFDISAGKGQVVDIFADEGPTLYSVEWPDLIGVTPEFIASDAVSRVSFNRYGAVVQTGDTLDDEDYRDNVVLGSLVHADNINITATNPLPYLPYANFQLEQFMRLFGALNISGNQYTANGANLQLDKASGTHWALGGNWAVDSHEPNKGADAAQSPVSTLFITYDSGDGQTLSTTISTGPAVISPSHLDDGSGTVDIAGVSASEWSARYVFFFPATGLTAIRLGNVVYSSAIFAEAFASDDLPFVTDDYFTAGYLRSIVLVKGDATDLSDDAQGIIIQKNYVSIGG